MSKSKNRIFAFLLAMAMIIGCLPAMAFAEESEGWSSDHSQYFYFNEDGELVPSATEIAETIKATCTTGTITVYRATDPGANGATDSVEANDALGHVYAKGKTTETTATCDKAGYHYNVCDRCGEPDYDHQIKDPALGHIAAEEPVKENEVPATCTTDGSYDEVIYCVTCGEEMSRSTKTVPANGEHSWVEDNTEEEAPTCTEPGSVIVKRICEVCGEEETETITTEALGHDWKLTKTVKKPTCGQEGEGEWTCTRCKAKETRPIEATGQHQFEEKQIYDDPAFQAPTCTEGGYEVYANICKKCGAEEEDSRHSHYVDALGHDYVKVSTEATCTLTGEAVFTCSRCGDTYDEIEEALGHVFAKNDKDEEIITETVKKAATCEEPGVKILSRHCTVCGEDVTEEEEIPALGHKLLAPVKENVKAATCEKDGSHDEVVYCSVCKKAIEKENVIDPATGHDWDEENPVEQNCQGTLYKCKNCDQLHKDTEIKAEHDWELTKTTKEATCTEDGEGVYTCKTCKETKEDTIPALGHTWSILVKEPTCTETGIQGGICSRCKEMSDYEEIPALGHTYNKADTTAKVYWNAAHDGTGYVVYTTPCANGCKNNKPPQVVNFEADEKGKEQKVELKLMKGGEEITATTSFIAKKTNEITTEPTCDKVGERTYTATFEQTLPSGKKVSGTDTWKVNDEDDLKATGHTNGEAVKEKVVAADCGKEQDGKYDLVVYCTVCGKEVSRNTITEKWKHTEAKVARQENFKNEDSHTLPTEFDYVWYCTVCNKELRRVHATKKKEGHVAAEPVKENVVEPDCKNGRAGSYDLVVYCKDCDPKVEISRTKVTVEPEHDWDWAVDVVKEANCTEKGLKREVLRCNRCGKEDKDSVYEWEYGPEGHDAYFTKTVTVKEPTCTEEGASADVTYCGICFEEIKRSKETRVPALGHTAMAVVRENEVAATCTEAGSYDEVVYCAVCGEEISREKKTTEAAGHNWGEGVVTKEPTADEKGIMTYTCQTCGETKTEEIDNSDLKPVVVPVITLQNKTVVYSGSAKKFNLTDAKVSGGKGKITFKYYSDIACKKEIPAPTKPGKYYGKAILVPDGSSKAIVSSVARLNIRKAHQNFSAYGKTATYWKSVIDKKTRTLKAATAFAVKNNEGTLRYTMVSGDGRISINRKTGRITVQKGLPTGTYKVGIEIKALNTDCYFSEVKTATVTINVTPRK